MRRRRRLVNGDTSIFPHRFLQKCWLNPEACVVLQHLDDAISTNSENYLLFRHSDSSHSLAARGSLENPLNSFSNPKPNSSRPHNNIVFRCNQHWNYQEPCTFRSFLLPRRKFHIWSLLLCCKRWYLLRLYSILSSRRRSKDTENPGVGCTGRRGCQDISAKPREQRKECGGRWPYRENVLWRKSAKRMQWKMTVPRKCSVKEVVAIDQKGTMWMR